MMKFEVKNLATALVSNLDSPMSFHVNAAETVCIAGESGSGKSVLLRCLADLMPHSGELELDEKSFLSMPANEWRAQVTLLPAESSWWFLTVGEYFKSDDDVPFSQLGFSADVRKWRVDRLSTGEKQRLSLLRVLQNKPKVLLLDEPTASLDPKSIERVEDCIAEYKKQNQCAVLWVSHDSEQIKRVANRKLSLGPQGLSEESV